MGTTTVCDMPRVSVYIALSSPAPSTAMAMAAGYPEATLALAGQKKRAATTNETKPRRADREAC
jgi:hypothetical protein